MLLWRALSKNSKFRACVNNVSRIYEAGDRWRVEHKKTVSDIPNEEDFFGQGRYLTEKPVCPAGGIYILGNDYNRARCSLLEHYPVDPGNACINHLRQIDGAKEQWALENKKALTDTPAYFDLIGSDRNIKQHPRCPAHGQYYWGDIAHKPTCSVSDHTLW